jgi:hypothetical protein
MELRVDLVVDGWHGGGITLWDCPLLMEEGMVVVEGPWAV